VEQVAHPTTTALSTTTSESSFHLRLITARIQAEVKLRQVIKCQRRRNASQSESKITIASQAEIRSKITQGNHNSEEKLCKPIRNINYGTIARPI
jgi:hypothetical protein